LSVLYIDSETLVYIEKNDVLFMEQYGG